MGTHIFVYGTLINERIWMKVVGKEHKNEPARLAGYRCGTIKNEVYPGIVKSLSEAVEGLLYFDLSQDDLVKLDEYETDFYLRANVKVWCQNQVVRCNTYIVKDEFTYLVGGQWDYYLFERQHLNDFLFEI